MTTTNEQTNNIISSLAHHSSSQPLSAIELTGPLRKKNKKLCLLLCKETITDYNEKLQPKITYLGGIPVEEAPDFVDTTVAIYDYRTLFKWRR
jgi:hypothetical protein